MNEQERADYVRVRGYFMAASRQMLIEKRTMRVLLEQEDVAGAREARLQMVHWLEQAELVAKVIASGDRKRVAEVALCLEEVFG